MSVLSRARFNVLAGWSLNQSQTSDFAQFAGWHPMMVYRTKMVFTSSTLLEGKMWMFFVCAVLASAVTVSVFEGCFCQLACLYSDVCMAHDRVERCERTWFNWGYVGTSGGLALLFHHVERCRRTWFKQVGNSGWCFFLITTCSQQLVPRTDMIWASQTETHANKSIRSDSRGEEVGLVCTVVQISPTAALPFHWVTGHGRYTMAYLA